MTQYSGPRFALAVLFSVVSLGATTIDFEAQGATASSFNGSLDSPLVIGIATFTGGKLLKNEAFGTPSADTSVVYATNGFISGYTDPLVITFSAPVSNVSLQVTNETPDTYTLADNVGHSSAVPIGNNVNQILSLTDEGVTRVTIATNATVGWDFAIDNVSFTAAPATTPEPASIALGSVGMLGIMSARWRRRRAPTERFR